MKLISLFTLFVLISTDSFSTEIWSLETSDFFPSFQSAIFTKDTHSYGVIAGLKGAILTSTDAGNDWYGNKITDCHWVGSVATDSLICCFAQPGIDNKDSLIAVFDMKDGEITLKATPLETENQTSRVTGVNLKEFPRVYMVNAIGSVYMSENNFENWTKTNSITDVLGFAKYDGLGNLWKVDNTYKVWKSVNNGTNWTLIENIDYNISDIKVSGQCIFLISPYSEDNNQKVYYSEDSGLTWKNFEVPDNKLILRISHCGDRLFATFDESGLMTNCVSSDYGNSWKDLELETSNNLLDYYFISEELGYAYGSNNSKGIIYKYTVDTSVPNEITSEAAVKIYPNPASNFITFDTKESIEKIEVYSAEGKKLLSSKQKRIDISELTAGHFYAKIYSHKDGNYYTRKFIVNK